jgi:hypothetical protein
MSQMSQQENATINKLIESLKNQISEAKKQLAERMDVIDENKRIVVWKDTYLTVAIDKSNNRYQVSSQVLAEEFPRETAEKICLEVKNGANDRPVVFFPVDYYSGLIDYKEAFLKELTENLNRINGVITFDSCYRKNIEISKHPDGIVRDNEGRVYKVCLVENYEGAIFCEDSVTGERYVCQKMSNVSDAVRLLFSAEIQTFK